MYTQSNQASSQSVVRLGAVLWFGLCLGLGVSPDAAAKCGCPDDGHGAPKVDIGLGESFPQAPDLAPDPAWQVYQFERDGIRYVQINDANGNVRAAVGRIDNTFWVMPIGSDADRVSIRDVALPWSQSSVLVANQELHVALRVQSGLVYWRIGAP